MSRHYAGAMVALVGCAGLLCGTPALASYPVVPVSSGPLNLTVSNTGIGTSTPGADGNISDLSVPGSYTYANTFNANQTGNPYGTTGNGFYDDWVFQVSAATVNSITSTIALTNALSISGLNVELYDFNANGQLAPVTGTPAGSYWQAVTLVNAGGVTVEQINATGLAAGTYVLQVSGTANGTSGGSYSGTLNVDLPVPLPGGLALMTGGVLLLAPFARRRTAR